MPAAGELMTAPAVTVTPAATIGQAARIMRRRRVGRLPVTHPRTGRLAGIVTRSDLLHVYLRPREEIRAEIEAEVLRRVPGVGRPRGPVRGRTTGYSAPNFLISSNSASVSCRGTSSLATLALCT